jgi:uncharacterized membrane protein YbhN (UPF0104 family)
MCRPTAWPAPIKRALTLLAGAAIGVGALISVFLSSGGLDDVREALERVTAAWTLAAVVAMLAGYLLLAVHLRRLTRGQISHWLALRIDLLLFGLGNILPGAPAPGAILAAAELHRAGLSRRTARFVLAFTAWFNIRTLLGIGAVAFLVAFARQHPGLKDAGLWWMAAIGVLLLLAATARIAARPTTAQRTAHVLSRLRLIRVAGPLPNSGTGAGGWHAEAKAIVGTPSNRAVLVTLAAGAWLADAACLRLALAAAGVNLDADVVLIAYVAGIIASAVPLLPGGFGAVEAAIPAVLHSFGAPLDAALAGTLVYRGISALLPAAAGALLLAFGSLKHREGTRPEHPIASETQRPRQ